MVTALLLAKTQDDVRRDLLQLVENLECNMAQLKTDKSKFPRLDALYKKHAYSQLVVDYEQLCDFCASGSKLVPDVAKDLLEEYKIVVNQYASLYSKN